METAQLALTGALAEDLDAAFPDLVRSRQDRLYSGVLRIVRHHADAADITQETLIRAYRALRGYETNRIQTLRLDGWLWTIALNLCRNRARNAHPLPSNVPDTQDPGRGPEAEAIDRTGTAAWDERLAKLTGPQRNAVVLRHVVGLSYREISEASGRPTGTVKADVHRGLDRLKKLFEAEAMR